MPTSTPSRGETRGERSRRTQERLLDATIESLIAVGYGATSMQELCTRAEVSRGAQLHHFPTKAKLMAAAVRHLAAKREAEVTQRYETLRPGVDAASAIIETIWLGFSGPLAQASLELWTAARTDPALLAALQPVEREVAAHIRELARNLIGPDVDEEPFQRLFWLTVSVTRGLAIDEILGGSDARRQQLIADWKTLASASLTRS